MKKYISIALLMATVTPAIAQLPEDALRMSWNNSYGTARQQAIGGAMGSLGGDITSLYVNPAGLGLYKTSEFVMSPGFGFYKSNGDFRGTNSKSSSLSRFQLGPTGFVSGSVNPYSRVTSSAFGIAVSRTANFNSKVFYKGQNDLSSYSEAFAEEFSRSGEDIEDVYDSPLLSLGTKMAIYTYLIDTATINGIKQVVGRPEYLGLVDQEQSITTTGGITEIALGYAGNWNNNFYLGGSIGIPILQYERTSSFTESDPSGDDDNNFNYSRFEQKLNVKGVGFNAKLGAIFAVNSSLRFGATVHTPTLYGLRETVSAKMVTDLEKLFGPGNPGADSVTSDYYFRNGGGQVRYNFNSPWRFIMSGSYLFGSVADITKQKGFVTADVEYVTYGASRFKPSEEDESDNYYDGVNDATKALYKSAFNFRVGGELKFNVLMTRLGFAYYTNPYKDAALDASRMSITGGLGYRDKGFFVDLAYIHNFNRNVDFPYRLSDKDNTFADIKENAGNVILTFGIKL